MGLSSQGHAYFSMDDRECQEKEKERCAIDVRYAPTSVGVHKFAVTFGSTDLSFVGNGVLPKNLNGISYSPSELDFGAVDVGEVRTRTIRLQNLGRDLAYIASHGAGEPFGATTVEGFFASRPYDVSVWFKPTKGGAVSSHLRVKLGVTVVEIPLRGSGIEPRPSPEVDRAPAPASVAVSPTALDFTTLRFDGADSTDFTVTNGTGSAVAVTSATVAADITAVMSLSVNGCTGQTLAPGGSCTVTVAVGTNVSAGVQNGQLTVATSAGTLTVSLSYTRVP